MMIERAPSAAGLGVGDPVRVRRSSGYWHHGVYLGNGRVVAFGGNKHQKADATISEVSLSEFQGGVARVMPYERSQRLAPWLPPPLPRDERLRRARFLVRTAKPGRYNLMGRNCEHVATWCVVGFPESSQVRRGLVVSMLLGIGFAFGASWAIRTDRKLPVGLILGVAATRAMLITQYHVHAGRFVREIDRAYRAETQGAIG